MKIGAVEAKLQFSVLLEMAARGEDVTITRHGKPVAKLVGSEDERSRSKARAVFSALKSLRRRETLGGLCWRDLRDEGRR